MAERNPSTLKAMDEVDVQTFHWRMVFTAGMGFFTDAYDLFVIGLVTAILAQLWHLSILQLAILNGASLASAAVGSIIFGILTDKLGRKKMYGIEILILMFGALLSAFSTSFMWLLVFRIVVGFGIGGDYPTSAVIASEYSNRKNRGFLVLIVFSMQSLGLVIGPILASALLALDIPHDYIWRTLLALGAVPAASVFYLRRKIPETPRFLISQKAVAEAEKVVSGLTGAEYGSKEKSFMPQKLLSKKWFLCLLGTAGAWFLLDVAFYGNGVSSIILLNALNPDASLLNNTLLTALIFLVFAVPGYFLAATTVDRLGRKPLQYLGFIMMAIAFSVIALVPGVVGQIPLFLLLFGISFFFVNFGPNATTFLMPSEVFPTNIRARAHGISAAVGKLGAFVGAFVMPGVLEKYGLALTLGLMAVVSILGIFATMLIPEMKSLSLDVTEVRH